MTPANRSASTFLSVCVALLATLTPSLPAAPLPALPNFDRRPERGPEVASKAALPAAAPAARARAEHVLRERLPTIQVDRHPIHGSPKWITSREGGASAYEPPFDALRDLGTNLKSMP